MYVATRYKWGQALPNCTVRQNTGIANRANSARKSSRPPGI